MDAQRSCAAEKRKLSQVVMVVVLQQSIKKDEVMRRAFTLIEVNLAIFIMAAGVLGIVSLYSLGLRENSQSVEDVASAGFADAFFAPLVAGLSSTNLTWNSWCGIGSGGSGDKNFNGIEPSKGWSDYVDTVGDKMKKTFRVKSGCNGTADGVFGKIAGAFGSTGVSVSKPTIPGDYYYGLVATRRGSTISLAFRASRRLQTLMSQPIYYTEVHFQGVR